MLSYFSVALLGIDSNVMVALLVHLLLVIGEIVVDVQVHLAAIDWSLVAVCRHLLSELQCIGINTQRVHIAARRNANESCVVCGPVGMLMDHLGIALLVRLCRERRSG